MQAASCPTPSPAFNAGSFKKRKGWGSPAVQRSQQAIGNLVLSLRDASRF
jgi:hypothetical protein